VLTSTTPQNPVSQVTARNLTGIAPDEAVGELVNRQNVAGQSYTGYTAGLTNQNVEYNPGYANQSYDQSGQLNQNVQSFAHSDSLATPIAHDEGRDFMI
jgi:hypothetical protein